MPRFRVPKHLVRKSVDAEQDAQKFDALCELAIAEARKIVPLALRRRTAATGSTALLQEAKSLLKFFVQEPAILEELAQPDLLTDLTQYLEEGLAQPSQELVEEQANDLGRVLMSAWVDLLKAALDTYAVPLLLLSNDLLPARVADDALLREWHAAIRPFGVSLSEAGRIMQGVRQQFIQHRIVELPLRLKLWAAESPYGALVMVGPAVLPQTWRRGTDFDLTLWAKYIKCDQNWVGRAAQRVQPMYPGRALGLQGIIHGGKYVYPREVEAVLHSCPGIAEATVIGVPTGVCEEEVRVIVRSKPRARVTQEQILQHCELKLPAYQRPTSVVFAPRFPRDSTGRLLLDELLKEVELAVPR